MAASPPPTGLAAWLRRRFRQHNLHVLGLSLFSLLGSLFLWAIVYGFAAWMTLLLTTIIAGTHDVEARMPPHFSRIFLACGGGLLLLAFLRQARRRNEAARDRKPLKEHALDLLLALPATSLAVWGNLRAWLWLSRREINQAARLVETILLEKRLPLSSAPVVIPNDARREKIVLSLMLTGILDLRRDEGTMYLRLARTVEPDLMLPGEITLESK